MALARREHAARPRVGVAAVLDDGFAGDEHVRDADRSLARILERGAIGDRRSVEHDQVGVEVRLDAPGFKPEQLDVQLMGEVLTITGKQEEKREENGKTFHVVERHAGNFTRNIALPCGVNANAIEAKFTDGVLTVRMPKTVEATGKKIQVKA